MKKLSLAALPLIVVIAACAPPTAQDSAEIRAGSAAFGEALNAGEIDTLVALYAEDARVMPPNAPAGQGRDAARESFGAMIDAGLGAELSSVEAVVAGDIGHHIGTYKVTAGDAVVDSGKFVEIWRLYDGEWKIAADIWNSDLPAAGGGTMVIGSHKVKDADHWLAAWQGADGRRSDFARHGAPNVHVFQSPEDPELTGLLIEVDDMDALMAWLASEDGAKAKAEDGVIDATLRILTQVE